MKQVFFIILFAFFVAEVSFSEVFKWIDEKGVVHFTDDISQIPEKYRPKAEKIELSEGKEESKIEGESAPKKKEDAYKDRLGRGEKYWKERMEEWRKKLSELQGRLEILRVKYNELTMKFNDSKSTVERGSLRRERDQIKNEMDQHKIKIEEAKNMLEKKIPEEVELYQAKPEWVKQ
jgi:chromosome segregation ATPase